jgi:hypothetical protein
MGKSDDDLADIQDAPTAVTVRSFYMDETEITKVSTVNLWNGLKTLQ